MRNSVTLRPRALPLTLILIIMGGLLTPLACTKSKKEPAAGGPCKDRGAENCLLMALSFYKTDPDASRYPLDYLCTKDFGKISSEACTLVGHIYLNGAPQTKKEPKKAIEYYDRGCPLKSDTANFGACFRMGMLWGKGILAKRDRSPWHAINKAKGKAYFTKACKLNPKWDLPCKFAKEL